MQLGDMQMAAGENDVSLGDKIDHLPGIVRQLAIGVEAASGIGSSIFFDVFGKFLASRCLASIWLAADSVGIQTILPPS